MIESSVISVALESATEARSIQRESAGIVRLESSEIVSAWSIQRELAGIVVLEFSVT